MSGETKERRGIYLVGFSGTGKSTIARLIGDMLGWPSYDLDEFIVERSGMEIPTIFQREGEPGFRSREAEALRAVSDSAPFVVATGGGAMVRPDNRTFMASKGWIICLEGRPETLLARLQSQQNESDLKTIRPMLKSAHPLDQIRALKHNRQSIYALADWAVYTDRLKAEQVAAEVVRAANLLEHSSEPPVPENVAGISLRQSLSPDVPPPVGVTAGPWSYNAVIDWGNLRSIGDQVKRVLPQARKVAILSDPETWQRLCNSVHGSFKEAGLEAHIRCVSPGEQIKTTNEVSAIHDWLLGIRLRRDDVFVVIGGAAIDDLGGFTASIYMRGIPLVKVPTSLEGMVDTAIGGKTALNHPRAHNLVGTFYHPRLVWLDASLLKDEPSAQLRASWAEVIKYAMLEGSLLRDQVTGETLFDQLEQHTSDLLSLQKPLLLKVIARCLTLKAQVVAGDERDSGQYRVFLNYGHTLGHALQAATDYKVLHGDAVSIGMAVEAGLSVRLGLADPAVEARQNTLLTRFGLPTRLPAVSRDLLLELIRSDKKVVDDEPRWILPVAVGRAVISSNVNESDLIAVLEEHSSAC
jgi:3-dehydroquinate synthase